MAKPTKKEANYHLPEHCCANCASSYFSSYSTPMCSQLNGFEMEVDFGGACDMWKAENTTQEV